MDIIINFAYFFMSITIYIFFTYLLNVQINLMLIPSPSSQIKKKIHLDCPICYSPYDNKDHYPMMICPNQHNCCNQCLDNLYRVPYLFKTIKCPDCRQPIRKKDATKFRLLDDIRQTTTELNLNNMKVRQILMKLRTEKIELSKELQAQELINEELAAQHKIERAIWQKKMNYLIKMKNGDKITQKITRQQLKKMVTNKQVSGRIYNISQRNLNSNQTRMGSKSQNQNNKHMYYINPEYELLHDKILRSKMGSAKKTNNFINKAFNQQKLGTNKTLSKHQQRSNSYSLNQSPVDGIESMVSKNVKIQINKSMVKLRGLGKFYLPYFILNEKIIRTKDLIQIDLAHKKQKQYPRRQAIIQILKDYNFTELVHLNLQNSQLRSIHFNKLQNKKDFMPHLQILNLKKNKLQYFPLFIFNLNNLRRLNLSHNSIDKIPSGIQKLQKLKWLQMWDNRLTELPVDLSFLQDLLFLELSNNKITELPQFLLDMKMLNQIDIFGNQIIKSSQTFKQFYKMSLQKNITVIHDSESLTSKC